MNITSDKKLKVIYLIWANFVGITPSKETEIAFIMGAKLCASNDGWFNPNEGDDQEDDEFIEEMSKLYK